MNVNPIAQPAAEVPRPASVRSVAAPVSVAQLAATGSHAQAPDPQAVKEAVAAANEAMKTIKSELDFSVDEDTGKTVIRVIDKQSGTLIRQMPSQEMLEIAKALDRLQGMLVRNSA
ncbi:MAG TPA: flagellar protein FlaG [Burkholderiales bacterium]|nr:flagellar protein FlaG [Burkholderiales bacterium]